MEAGPGSRRADQTRRLADRAREGNPAAKSFMIVELQSRPKNGLFMIRSNDRRAALCIRKTDAIDRIKWRASQRGT
jgi:hypothetical protein